MLVCSLGDYRAFVGRTQGMEPLRIDQVLPDRPAHGSWPYWASRKTLAPMGRRQVGHDTLQP